LKEQKLISAVRCSTRPDRLSAGLLQRLKTLGLDTVELGIQSFCAEPLAASGRGYSPETAVQACQMVPEAGMALGIQLMPGMPGMRREHFLRDVERCVDIKPAFIRLYPCLVLEGTALAGLWRKNLFKPWTLELVLELLPEALLTLWKTGIKVIRMGLAPQKELEGRILSGPAHPALGQMLRSRALLKLLADKIRAAGPSAGGYALHAPGRFQGEFYGQRKEQAGDYANLGLKPDRVRWWDKDYFELEKVRSQPDVFFL
jgi:histone acetyltransferase (RNA polymerase elongator complex component)